MLLHLHFVKWKTTRPVNSIQGMDTAPFYVLTELNLEISLKSAATGHVLATGSQQGKVDC